MERITFEGNFCDIAKCQEVMCPYGKDCSQKRVWERLKYYEDMEEQGRLVVLPCKVGDTVWLLKQKCKHAGEQNKPWDSCNQYWSNVYSKGMWGCAGRDSEGNTFPCEKKEMVWYAHEMEYSLVLCAPHIVPGKNLFLTREEAEQVLKGGAN